MSIFGGRFIKPQEKRVSINIDNIINISVNENNVPLKGIANGYNLYVANRKTLSSHKDSPRVKIMKGSQGKTIIMYSDKGLYPYYDPKDYSKLQLTPAQEANALLFVTENAQYIVDIFNEKIDLNVGADELKRRELAFARKHKLKFFAEE